jgi:hypothetical protein
MEPNKVHNMHGAFDNKVSFIDDFKQYEVVLDNSNKIMNNDLINGATFNYFSPIVNPVEHFLKDVYPWLQWGKSKYDITTKIERIVAYSTDFADTIDIMRKDWNKLSKNSNVDHLFKDVLFSDFFMGVLNDKSLSNYNFSKTDKWLKDDIEYEVFKNKIKEVVIKNLLNFKIK